MIKKVLFVNGPSQDPSDRFFGWPTPLLYAIAPTIQAIKDGNLELDYVQKIFDPIWYVEGENSDNVKNEFRDIIEKESVEIVCASATYDSLYPTLQLFAEARKVNADMITILGGPQFDEIHNLQDNEIGFNKIIDFAIAGDGEYALEAILRATSKGSVNNISLKDVDGNSWVYHDENVQQTNGKSLNLDKLPFFPIGLVNIDRHKNNFDIFADDNKNILPTIQMIVQRGCFYDCNFCSERNELAKPNARSIDSILEEIALRKSQGFRAIFFDDSTFGTYRSKQGGIKELLTELEKTGIVFGSLNRFNHLNNENSLENYRKAGFKYIYCSIEQLDNDALKNMNKKQKVNHIKQSLKLLNQYGFRIGVSLLYGLPYESDESITTTLDFTKQWVDNGTIILVSESVLSYHPGTPAGQTLRLSFNRTPPNAGHPFDKFEEGQWYHPKHVNQEYLDSILQQSQNMFENAMVRNRHSWYAEQGLLLNRT